LIFFFFNFFFCFIRRIKTQLLIKDLKNKKINYQQIKITNKSRALNIGIQKAQGDILAFTDDDCIVNNDWLSKIENAFNTNPNIAMLFGKSLPYKKTNHKNLVCPSVFTDDSDHIISQPVFHATSIGLGNNMAIKKSSSKKNLFFSTWLGPGSIAHAAEDAEIALRFLINKKKIKYDAKVLVFHNRWLNPTENFNQFLKYLCGETACYGYYFFQGYSFAKPIIKNNFKDSFQKFKFVLKKILSFKNNQLNSVSARSTLLELFFRIKGLTIGLGHAIRNKLKKRFSLIFI